MNQILGLQPAEIIRLEDQAAALETIIRDHNASIAQNLELKQALRDAAYLLERAEGRWAVEARLLAARIRGQWGD